MIERIHRERSEPAEMSDKDNHPASGDTARPVYPVLFDGQDGANTNFTDWRAKPVPADAAEEEVGPKVSSAPEPASSSESPQIVEVKAPEKPAPAVVTKASGPSKVSAPGTPGSSSPKTTGKL